MNEIELNIKGKIYRLTNVNNGNKHDRAKADAGPNANQEQVLAHYDKLLGYIQDKNGNKVINGSFWAEEKKRLEMRKKQKESLQLVERVTSHPVISAFLIIFLLGILWYIFGIDLSRFN